MKKNYSILDELLPEPKFLGEWTEKQFAKMRRAILRYFQRDRIFIFNNRGVLTPKTWKELDIICGFAYTSSSAYAGCWVCNGDLAYNHHYRFIGFALSEDGKPYGIAWDKDEHELLIRL